MTDRELLELAAKAAGIDLTGWTWTELSFAIDYECPDPDVGRYWNPLTDDGDALRLAVKLRLDIQFEAESVGITNVITHDEDGFETGCEFMLMDDATSATRRAIVRAAAEIGKAMP